VYRGPAIPDLVGTYVFTDYYAAGLYGIDYDRAGTPFKFDVATGLPIAPAAFAEDLDGELYVLDLTGEIWRIVPAGEPAPDAFPDRLSATGCFEGADPVPALIPYDVNAALWADGADKERWLAIPDGTSITVGPDGDWELPIGAVVAKEFRVGGQRVETRLLMRHADGTWAGYAYAWEGDDAVLAEGGRTVASVAGPWRIPSSPACLACHTEAAGRLLGLETAQLDRVFAYPEGEANQIAVLTRIGVLDPSPLDVTPLPDPTGSTGTTPERARAYLHANCAHCHRPDGPAPATLDLRYGVAGGDGCGMAPIDGDLGVTGALVLDPGHPERSVLSLRMHRTDVARMPPLGTSVVDPLGTALVDTWIAGLRACP
jgi:uncharacterized repeat protein (TIGR03806 family)